MKKKIFERMCAIVEQPDYPLLKSYQNDLYSFDREMIERTWAPGIKYLWVVRECGTYLSVLAMDIGASRSALATLNSSNCQEIYLIDAQGDLTLIDRDTAIEFAQKVVYTIDDGYIYREGKKIAGIVSTLVAEQHRQYGKVEIGTLLPPTKLDMAAFERIAISETIEKSGSLFVSVHSLVIDGIETLGRPQEKTASAPEAESKAKLKRQFCAV